jgi:hypothetical protein
MNSVLIGVPSTYHSGVLSLVYPNFVITIPRRTAESHVFLPS